MYSGEYMKSGGVQGLGWGDIRSRCQDGVCTKDEELHTAVVAQCPLHPHLSTLNKSPTTMFCKLFVPVFLLLAFAAHSTLSVITSMKAPQGALTPGKTFTVTLFTKPPKKDEFCTVFGLHPEMNWVKLCWSVQDVVCCRWENGPACELPTETELMARACHHYYPEYHNGLNTQKSRISLW